MHVLHVDDDADFTTLVRAALAGVDDPPQVSVAHDGDTALERLRREGHDVDLVLLDLRLPTISGVETLRELRANPRLRHVPVIMMTSSRRDDDVVAAYEAGANAYVGKPGDYGSLQALLASICQFWGRITRAPRA